MCTFIRGTRHGVDMSNEFRHLTLQVIGEAVLSLEAKECDQVLFQGMQFCDFVFRCLQGITYQRWRNAIDV